MEFFGFGINSAELLVILAVSLLVLGPKQIVQLVHGLARVLAWCRVQIDQARQQLDTATSLGSLGSVQELKSDKLQNLDESVEDSLAKQLESEQIKQLLDLGFDPRATIREIVRQEIENMTSSGSTTQVTASVSGLSPAVKSAGLSLASSREKRWGSTRLPINWQAEEAATQDEKSTAQNEEAVRGKTKTEKTKTGKTSQDTQVQPKIERVES